MSRTTEEILKDAEDLLIIEKTFQLECPFDNRMATPDMAKYGDLLRAISMAKRLLKENKELSDKLREREDAFKSYCPNMLEYYNGYAQAQKDGVGQPLTDDKDVQIVIDIQKKRIKELEEYEWMYKDLCD